MISDAERERASETRRLVYQYMPEIVPFIKELHSVGLLDGWRRVTFRFVGEAERAALTPLDDRPSARSISSTEWPSQSTR